MAKPKIDILTEQTGSEENFRTWFDNGLKTILDDNRRRYRMKLKDRKEREARGLSALPSTKSTSAVDRAVEKALMEYHGEPDAITFTSKSTANPQKDQMVKYFTEIFKYRMKHTFPFFTWHSASLTAGYTDGMEAGIVSWIYESYKKTVHQYFYDGPNGIEEISDAMYGQGRAAAKRLNDGSEDLFIKNSVKEDVVTKDTFWIDALKPGIDLCWDFNIPILDLNLCQWVLVKTKKTLQEMENLSRVGVFDLFREEDALTSQGDIDIDDIEYNGTVPDVADEDQDEFNRVPIWIYFKKENNRWMVYFSIQGKKALSTGKSVDEVFFNDKEINILPVVMGSIKAKLWESIGRGLPESIAPIEDEWTDHRNNVSDASKIAIQGRFRISHDAQVDIDQVLNSRVFRADKQDIEKVDTNPNIVDSLRAADSIAHDIGEMVPVGMESKNIVPRGNARTLGAVELSLGAQNEKLSVQLLHRNETFFSKIMYIVGCMIQAYENDETIMRIAAVNAKVPTPEVPAADGRTPQIDLSVLDFPVEVQINAGLGAMPTQQKADLLMQVTAWRKQNGIPTDMAAVASQINVLAGFQADAFSIELPPPKPPEPEISANVNIDFNQMAPVHQKILIDKLMSASGQIKVKAKNESSTDPDGVPGSPGLAGEGGSSDLVGPESNDLDTPSNYEEGGPGGYA